MFASEFHPLAEISRSLKLDAAGFEIQQLASGHGAVVDLDRFSIERFATTGPIDESVHGTAHNDASRFTFDVTSVDGTTPRRELVRDVALIAGAPNAAKFESMLEHNHERRGETRPL